MSGSEGAIATARLTLGEVNYRVAVTMGQHELVADEPASRGGDNAGAAPFELLLAALGSCTAITLRMYAARKGWELGEIQIQLAYRRAGDKGVIDRRIAMAASLTEEQHQRLLEIADKTPVTLAVRAGSEIRTTLA